MITKLTLVFIMSLSTGAYATTSNNDEEDYIEAYGTKITAPPIEVEVQPSNRQSRNQVRSSKRLPGERSDKGPPFDDEDLEENLK